MNIGILFFLSIVGWALLLMLLLPRLKAGHALMSALCGMLFVSYFGVIVARIMQPTAYVLLYGGLGMLAVGMVTTALGKRGLRKRLCSVGLLCYLVFALAGALLMNGCVVSDHDSLSYWARIVKELFTYERFPIHGDATMYHSDYFPMLASLQYCLMRVFGWQDAYLLYVTYACILVSIAAVVDLLRSRLWAIVAALLLPYAFTAFGSPLFFTRADGPISALFAAGALCLFMREDDNAAAWLPAFCAAVVLTGLKIYTGLMLSLLLCACMLLCVRGVKRRGNATKPLLVMGIVALVCTLALQFSWSALYHYTTRLAAYEAAVAAVPYTGVAFEGARPTFLLRDLFTGNPRTESLLQTLNAETLENVSELIGNTFADYAASSLPWLWAFLLPVAILAALATRGERRRILGLFGALLVAAALYTLGLFASYVVQAETYGAAVTYLVTVTTPLCWAALFVLLRAADAVTVSLSSAKAPSDSATLQAYETAFFASPKLGACKWATGGVCAALLLTIGGMLLLSPPASFAQGLQFDHELESFSALANDYYTYEIADQLTPEDLGKRALLIDCSYAASEVKSESGKTHAYQYYGMPMRVTVLQYPYADYDLLDSISTEMLVGTLNHNRCDLLLLYIDDEVYWEMIRDALSLEGDWDAPIAVYDVLREDGEVRFHCRLDDM